MERYNNKKGQAKGFQSKPKKNMRVNIREAE